NERPRCRDVITACRGGAVCRRIIDGHSLRALEIYRYIQGEIGCALLTFSPEEAAAVNFGRVDDIQRCGPRCAREQASGLKQLHGRQRIVIRRPPRLKDSTPKSGQLPHIGDPSEPTVRTIKMRAE